MRRGRKKRGCIFFTDSDNVLRFLTDLKGPFSALGLHFDEMVVGKLRMKGADPSKSPKRRRRRKTRSPSIDPPLEPYGPDALDSFTARSSVVPTGTDGKQKSRAEGDDDFLAKLREALRAEDGDMRLETLFENDVYVPRRWQGHSSFVYQKADLSGHQLGQLEGEEYDEYIRQRMWSQSNRQAYLHQKEREERERQQRQRTAEERAKQRLKDEKRAERKAVKESRRLEKSREKCRERYHQRWEIINSAIHSGAVDSYHSRFSLELDSASSSSHPILSFDEIPWPVYTLDDAGDGDGPASLSLQQIDIASVREFLLGHIPQDDVNSRRKILRTALLSYHPDRFERVIRAVKEVSDNQTKAKEWGLRVSQLLNDLNQSL